MLPTYSIAKTFTAAALLESGLRLDARIGDYLDLPDHYAKRPVRQVLQHTSGLADYHALSEYREAVAQRLPAWSTAELLDRCQTLPDKEFGHFSYSNIGFTLLRMILEELNQSSFYDALVKRVFTPLNIIDVAPLEELGDWDRVPLATDDIKRYDPRWVYPRMVAATSQAMAQTFQGIFSGSLCDPRPFFEGVSVSAPGHTFTEPEYGLGLMMDGQRWVGHGGGGPGFALFALCRRDGSAAHVAYSVGENQDDAPLIAECLAKIA